MSTAIGPRFLFLSARDLLLGAPLPIAREHEERLPKRHALTTIGADNIASSVYGPESMLRALTLAGGIGALAHVPALTVGILSLLFVVGGSYLQTIDAYPDGGGSYVVAKDNLGQRAGLVAAVALMIDYVLNVAVSVTAGVMSITSICPTLGAHRVSLCLGILALLTLGNLRGARSAAWWFSTPVYLYLVCVFALIGYGLFELSRGRLPTYQADGADVASIAGFGVGAGLGVFALLRAFASGAVALSGVEAISNGVPAFRPPETRNAKITLLWMIGIFGTLFVGLTLLAARLHVIPDPNEIETIVSRIARTLLGPGPRLWLVQGSAAVMLAVAANTSYADFPRLANILARDRFLPRGFAVRGRRLAFDHGILTLSLIAAALIVIFRGSLTSLVPLFTIGLFVSFTLSEVGMVVHHWRRREPRWRLGLLLNGGGAVVTGGVALLEAVTKFTHGAWMVLVLIPLLTHALVRIRRTY